MKRAYAQGKRWAIILAGGEGERMKQFNIRRFGEPRPKQYCSFLGEQSMLEHTMDRAANIVGRQRIVTVIGKGHLRYFYRRLAHVSGLLVEQPQNLGTGPGVFLPLSYVLAYDPRATVLIFPSDHYIRPNNRFVESMSAAADLAERFSDRLVLGAAVADYPEAEYGWIEPGSAIAGWEDASTVKRFCEKPDVETASRFFEAGYYWNTLNMAVKGETLWELGQTLYPSMMAKFDALRLAVGTAEEAAMLGTIYEHMAPLNFSQGILERASNRSVVLPMTGVEWSDWGSPNRVQKTLDVRTTAAVSA